MIFFLTCSNITNIAELKKSAAQWIMSVELNAGILSAWGSVIAERIFSVFGKIVSL